MFIEVHTVNRVVHHINPAFIVAYRFTEDSEAVVGMVDGRNFIVTIDEFIKKFPDL